MGGEEVGEETLEEEHFPRGGDESGVWGFVCRPGPVKVVRAVTGEAELHDWVLELLLGDFFFCKRRTLVDGFRVGFLFRLVTY